VSADLDRFYDVPTSVTARLVGGPFDGEERPFPGQLLQNVFPRLVVVMPPGGLPVIDGSGPPLRMARAEYEARRDAHGFLSRDDGGRVRFDFGGQW
jgi:hypothetical protein